MEERKNQKQKNKNKVSDFYLAALNAAEQENFELAAGVDGIDDEIAYMRTRLRKLMQQNTENLVPVMKASDVLAKLVKTRYSMTKDQKKGLKDAISTVLKEVAIPLGIKVLERRL